MNKISYFSYSIPNMKFTSCCHVDVR